MADKKIVFSAFLIVFSLVWSIEKFELRMNSNFEQQNQSVCKSSERTCMAVTLLKQNKKSKMLHVESDQPTLYVFWEHDGTTDIIFLGLSILSLSIFGLRFSIAVLAWFVPTH